MISPIWRILKNYMNQLIYKTETDLDLQTLKTNDYQMRKMGEQINYELGMNTYTLLYIK